MTQVGGPLGLIKPNVKRYELNLHSIKSENIEPNGDRYLIEVIDISETHELGQILVVTPDANVNPKDPSAPPNVEQRGVIAGVVIRGGNGHLLGLPDPPVVKRLMSGGSEIMRVSADVPMFYEPGDVVFVDRNARGRALRIFGKEARIVNQIDVLAKVEGIRLVRDGDTWQVQVEEVAQASEEPEAE